ncbi:MAG: hypothetical protein AAF485_24615 [Chloroflexota bacterium]
MMSRQKIFRIIFFAVIALLLLSELVFSNIGSFGNIEAVAEQLGLTVAAERVRLYILILFDAIGGVGALLALWGLFRSEAASTLRLGVLLTTIGLVGYGVYQFFSALFQLGDAFRIPIMIVGVVYAGLGIVTWTTNRSG